MFANGFVLRKVRALLLVIYYNVKKLYNTNVNIWIIIGGNYFMLHKKLGIFVHDCTYLIFKTLFKLIRKHQFYFVNKQPILKSNVIYAVNHSCKFDIPYVCEAINRHCYVLVGKQPLYLIDRILFNFNGVIWVDRQCKKSRKQSMKKLISIINNGGNILLFPEGTWNLTPSKPMLPLYWGVVDIARVTNRPIIPVVLEYNKNKCIISFGQCFRVTENDDKSYKIKELRDIFASLKWNIWEKSTKFEAQNDDWEKIIKQRLIEYPKLDYDYELSCIRKEYDDKVTVYKHLNNITPKLENAFLFNKRLK